MFEVRKVQGSVFSGSTQHYSILIHTMLLGIKILLDQLKIIGARSLGVVILNHQGIRKVVKNAFHCFVKKWKPMFHADMVLS